MLDVTEPAIWPTPEFLRQLEMMLEIDSEVKHFDIGSEHSVPSSADADSDGMHSWEEGCTKNENLAKEMTHDLENAVDKHSRTAP